MALVVSHQANLRIIRAMQERLGLPDEKVMVNIDRYGNTTGGTIPLALRDAVDQGKSKKGDLVLLMAVGAGYTTGSVLLRWACSPAQTRSISRSESLRLERASHGAADQRSLRQSERD